MKHVFKNRQSGFSLVELMIVVGIIGVLATLALPRFKQFQAKAKLSEAGNNLAHIYTLQQSYSLDNNSFDTVAASGANLTTTTGSNACPTNQIGFTIEPCGAGPTPRFSYTAVVGSTGSITSSFNAIATTGNMANNRICVGNATITNTLSHLNATSWTGGGTTGTGAAPIGTICGS